MQTYTHYVMTALIKQRLNAHEARANPDEASIERVPPLRSGWLMLGSILPDLPLILLAVASIALDLINGNKLGPGSGGAASQSYTEYLFSFMFFHDPWVIAAHNLFHAPLMVIFYLALGYWVWQRGQQWGSALFWLGAACALHTLIDIPLHYDDGPLLLFPFDWQTRFYSPVSYWDPERYGVPFAIFEHLLLAAMVLYLAINWWRKRRQPSVTTMNREEK